MYGMGGSGTDYAPRSSSAMEVTTKLPNIRVSGSLSAMSGGKSGNFGVLGRPAPSAPKYGMTINEVVRMGSGKTKFDNDIVYELPQSHQIYKSSRYLTAWKLENGKRGTSTEKIFENAKTKSGGHLGPSSYTHTGAGSVERTTKRFLNSKADRVTFIEQIGRSEKKTKGPTDYSPIKKVKVHGVYTYNEARNREFNKNLAHQKTMPAPTSYTTAEIKDKINYPKGFKANLNRNTAPRSPAPKKDSGPSPHHYKDADTKWKRLSHVDSAKSPTYTIPKENKSGFTATVIKGKNHVPSPNHYKKTTISDYKMLSHGPSSVINKYKRGL